MDLKLKEYIVIKLTSNDSNGVAVDIAEYPPLPYYQLRYLNPGENLGDMPNDEKLMSLGYGVFEYVPRPFENVVTENKKVYTPIGITKHSDGVWRHTWEERDATAEELSDWVDPKIARAVILRNKLLKHTDFVFAPDAPKKFTDDIEAWKTYRQELRDITKQANFPNNIVWPEAPIHIETTPLREVI
jgi:hypothetical protein